MQLLRELRDKEFDWAKAHLWIRHRWLERGIPVTIKNAKITPIDKKNFKLEAEGTPHGPPIGPGGQMPVPKIEGQVIIMPSIRTLDQEITEFVVPFYTIRGGVEALEIALNLPPHGDERKEERYLKLVRSLDEQPNRCSNCGHPKDLKSPRMYDDKED